jgi:hypothetical protein
LKIIIRIFLVVFINFVGCTSNEIANEETTKKYSKKNLIELAESKYANGYRLLESADKENVLCYSVIDINKLMGEVTDYFVFSKKENLIIYKNKIINGHVSWYSNNELKVLERPGMIKKNTNLGNGYIINIKTNLKTKLNRGVN